MWSINPESKQTARNIDQMFRHEKSESYYTMSNLDPAKAKKFEQVTDVMYVHLSKKWMKHANLTSRDARLARVTKNAKHVASHVKNMAALPMVNQATVVALERLDHHAANNIPLFSGAVPKTNRVFSAANAITPPASEAGYHRSPSIGSAHEPPPISEVGEPVAYENVAGR